MRAALFLLLLSLLFLSDLVLANKERPFLKDSRKSAGEITLLEQSLPSNKRVIVNSPSGETRIALPRTLESGYFSWFNITYDTWFSFSLAVNMQSPSSVALMVFTPELYAAWYNGADFNVSLGCSVICIKDTKCAIVDCPLGIGYNYTFVVFNGGSNDMNYTLSFYTLFDTMTYVSYGRYYSYITRYYPLVPRLFWPVFPDYAIQLTQLECYDLYRDPLDDCMFYLYAYETVLASGRSLTYSSENAPKSLILAVNSTSSRQATATVKLTVAVFAKHNVTRPSDDSGLFVGESSRIPTSMLLTCLLFVFSMKFNSHLSKFTLFAAIMGVVLMNGVMGIPRTFSLIYPAGVIYPLVVNEPSLLTMDIQTLEFNRDRYPLLYDQLPKAPGFTWVIHYADGSFSASFPRCTTGECQINELVLPAGEHTFVAATVPTNESLAIYGEITDIVVDFWVTPLPTLTGSKDQRLFLTVHFNQSRTIEIDSTVSEIHVYPSSVALGPAPFFCNATATLTSGSQEVLTVPPTDKDFLIMVPSKGNYQLTIKNSGQFYFQRLDMYIEFV